LIDKVSLPSKTIMSTYFSKVIKAGDRLREFNFRLLSQGADMQYHVDVPDEKGNRVIFRMSRNDDGNWKPDASILPAWIVNAEDQLNDVLREQMDTYTENRRK
jgi:hypothetical protein